MLNTAESSVDSALGVGVAIGAGMTGVLTVAADAKFPLARARI